MSKIIDEIKESIPKEAKISDISYEGSEIIVYTKNKEFFKTSTDLIRRSQQDKEAHRGQGRPIHNNRRG